MKDLSEQSFPTAIEIFQDQSNWLLAFTQESYIKKVLERFNMHNFSFGIISIFKGKKIQ